MDKKEIKIDKSVLHITTDCTSNFGCLRGNEECMCDVVASNEKDILEIKSKGTISCKYCISLESASFCTCPTRNEIYNCYKM